MRPCLLSLLVGMIACAIWLAFGRADPGVAAIAPPSRTADAFELADTLAEPDVEERSAGVAEIEAPIPVRILRPDDPMALLRVRIVDAERHEPLSEANVTFRKKLDPPRDRALERGADIIDVSLTGADGTVLQMVEPGTAVVLLVATPLSRGAQVEVAPLRASEERDVVVELIVAPDHVLCGRVVARDTGKPLADAVVTIEPKHDIISVATDGTFRAATRSWRDRHLEVRAPGYGRRSVSLEPGHETAERALEIVLDRGATLRVRLLDPGDSPVSRAVVELSADGRDLSATPLWKGIAGAGSSTWPADTDENGFSAWTDLPTGVPLRARVLRQRELVHTEPAAIVLDVGEQRELTWHIAATSEVRGVVREANGEVAPRRKLWLQPAQGEKAAILRFGGGAEKRATTADDSGRFRFRDVPPGSWWIAPAEPEFGHRDPVRDPVSLGQRVEVSDSGAPVDVDVLLQRGLVVRGRVTAPDGVTPSEGFISARRDGGLLVHANTNTDGEFVLGPLLPGRWKLLATSQFRAYRQSEHLDIDAGATNVVLSLRAAADVRVRVVDEHGTPVPSAEVLISQGRYPSESVKTDSAGIARAAGWFPEGVGAVTCALPDGRWGLVKDVRMSVDAPTEVELRLQPGVRALLRCSTVAPRNGIEVLYDGVSVAQALLAPGRVVAVTLPVGRITLKAVVEGVGAVEREIVVEPGTAPEFTFDGAWR